VIPEAVMRRSAAAVVSVAWGVALGGTFACLLPYLLNDWQFHRPLPYWAIAQAAGGLLICAGLVPVVQSFIEFIRANGTPVPVASPPRLVVSGCYRYVRNPIYVGFMAILLGEVLVFGSRGLLEYTAVAWCIGAAAVRFYEEPILARKFGAEYQDYRHAVRAWIPRLHPWTPVSPPDRQHASQADGRPAITSERPAKISRNHMARIKGVSSAQARLNVRDRT
jgi:protein-S-isoprenylcysteine O-methyltransferase Ste14